MTSRVTSVDAVRGVHASNDVGAVNDLIIPTGISH